MFLRQGAIVHAETPGARGRAAFFDIAGWEQIEFAYDRTVRPPVETINEAWHEMLIDSLGSKATNDPQEERRRA